MPPRPPRWRTLVPADILNLAPGRQRYTQFLNADGGILDDLMVHRPADPALDGRLMLVVNAARKEADFAHLAKHLPPDVRLERQDDRALIALQGPDSAAVMTRLGADVADWPFMAAGPATVAGIAAHVSRSGYTGEDGYEISVPAVDAVVLWRALVADPRWRRLASAPAIRCGWKAGSASTATTSTKPRRRWRPTSCGRSRSGGARWAGSPAPT